MFRLGTCHQHSKWTRRHGCTEGRQCETRFEVLEDDGEDNVGGHEPEHVVGGGD